MTPHFLHRMSVCLAAVVLIATSAIAATQQTKTPERIQVTWGPTDKLSEVKDNPMQRGWLRPEDWQKDLGDFLRARADLILPPGQHLDVTIDDIKLAGDFEPWHGSNAWDIRILKDTYPPRIDLHYRLAAADGSILREGSDKLRDMAYLQRTVSTSTDPLRYDKRMIEEWLRAEFRAPQA
jgi:hypothetical protein